MRKQMSFHQVERAVARYNASLLPGEAQMAVEEMVSLESIEVVECPHPAACQDCAGMNCMRIEEVFADVLP